MNPHPLRYALEAAGTDEERGGLVCNEEGKGEDSQARLCFTEVWRFAFMPLHVMVVFFFLPPVTT